MVSSTGEEVFFKIKRSTKLSKLQGAYASKVGKDVSSIRYVVVFGLFIRGFTPLLRVKVVVSLIGLLTLFFGLRHSVNRFLYDGERIQEDDTPASLDMEDNGSSLPSRALPIC